MDALSDARRAELIDRLSAQLDAWNLREPAIVFLTMHSPLAFLASQFLLAAQPFLGVFIGEGAARELAELIQDPQNIELLVTRLEESTRTSTV